jgi:ribosomal-protein-alanine N-acetyltransferase
MQRPHEWTLEGFQGLVARLLSQPRQAFVMVLQQTGAPVGCSSFLAIRPEHGGLEIGTTWINGAYHGTYVNPEAKFLMMQHAFEDLGTLRVEYLVRLDNLRSQAAVAKLGAVREGVLRNHTITPDGTLVDYVSYSVIPTDWPRVKQLINQRLDTFTPR